MKTLFCIVLGLCIALIAPKYTHALEADFSVKPSRVDLMIKPNQKVVTTFSITNYGDPQTIVPRITNAAVDPSTGTLSLSKSFQTPASFIFPNGKRDIGDPIFLKSNETVEIPITLETIQGEQRDYYYYFTAEAQNPTVTEGSSSVSLIPRIGVPIVVTLTNIAEREIKTNISIFTLKSSVSINLFGRNIHLIETGSPIPVDFHVSNTGSNVVNPIGKILLKHPRGGEEEYPMVRRNIYAHSSRLMLSESSYEAKCTDNNECRRSSLVVEGFLIGPYTLTAYLDNGLTKTPVTQSLTVLVLPFRLLFALLVFLVIYVVLSRRNRNHSNTHNHKK